MHYFSIGISFFERIFSFQFGSFSLIKQERSKKPKIGHIIRTFWMKDESVWQERHGSKYPISNAFLSSIIPSIILSCLLLHFSNLFQVTALKEQISDDEPFNQIENVSWLDQCYLISIKMEIKSKKNHTNMLSYGLWSRVYKSSLVQISLIRLNTIEMSYIWRQ